MRTTSRLAARGGMQSITVHAPVVRLELGLEHERRRRDTGARRRATAPAGAISQRPCVGVAEQRREAGAGVEAREAQPVDRAVVGRPARRSGVSPISA